MAVTETRGGSEPIDLKSDLHQFVEAINGMGKKFGLNPHLKDIRLNAVAQYRPTIAAISETGFIGKLKEVVGAGNIARILEVPPKYRSHGFDYFFLHNSPLRPGVFSRLESFAREVEKATGTKIFLVAREDTQDKNGRIKSRAFGTFF